MVERPFAIVIIGVRIDVLLSYWSNDMYSAAQVAVQAIGGDEAVRQSGVHGFWWSWVTFGTLATLYVVRVMLDLFLMQRFILAWRAWLTDRLTGDWLEGHAYYRTRFIADGIDNPDQRIQSDIDIFTTGVNSAAERSEQLHQEHVIVRCGGSDRLGDLVRGDPVEHVPHLHMVGVQIPRAMFWIGLLYVSSPPSWRSGSVARSSDSRSTMRNTTPASGTR